MNTEKLSAFISRAMREQGLTCIELAQRGSRAGYNLKYTTIKELANGRLQRPSVDALEAVAAGLNLTLTALLSAGSNDITIQLTGVEAKCEVGRLTPVHSYDTVRPLREIKQALRAITLRNREKQNH